MAVKSRPKPSSMRSYVPLEREVASALAALDEYIEESTSSVEAATKSLKDAGILDEKGRLKRRYRS